MYSIEHKEYLKRQKKEKRIVLFFQILIIAFLLFLWQLLADFNIVNTFISSSPKMVVKTIIGLHKGGELYHHIWITLYETILSFGLGTAIGILFATLMWWFPRFAKIVDPYLTVLNSLPKVALGPIIIIWAGAGMNSIIIMSLLISVILTIINVYQGFSDIDNNLIRMLQSFHCTKSQLYFQLILPSSFINIINSLKINVSMSLIGIIMGEFLVSKSGIGYLIMYGSQVFNLNLVISGIVILCIVSAVMYYGIYYLEKKISFHE